MDEPSFPRPVKKAADPREESRVLQSEELFAGQRVVFIEHAGQRYRLLITRNERLILQK